METTFDNKKPNISQNMQHWYWQGRGSTDISHWKIHLFLNKEASLTFNSLGSLVAFNHHAVWVDKLPSLAAWGRRTLGSASFPVHSCCKGFPAVTLQVSHQMLGRTIKGTWNNFSDGSLSDILTHQRWSRRWSGWLPRSGHDNMVPLLLHRWSRDDPQRMQRAPPHRGFHSRPSWMWMSRMEERDSSEGKCINRNKRLH